MKNPTQYITVLVWLMIIGVCYMVVNPSETELSKVITKTGNTCEQIVSNILEAGKVTSNVESACSEYLDSDYLKSSLVHRDSVRKVSESLLSRGCTADIKDSLVVESIRYAKVVSTQADYVTFEAKCPPRMVLNALDD
jgi:hypothetical protein